MKRITAIFSVIMAACCLFGGCGCRDKDRYYDDKKGFSLVIPNGWAQVKPMQGGDLALVPPVNIQGEEFPAIYTIVVREIKNPPSLADYQLENIEKIKSVLTGFRMISSGEERIGGETAGMIHFSYVLGIPRMEVVQYIILEDGRQISLTFTSPSADFNRYLDDVKKITYSFRCEN